MPGRMRPRFSRSSVITSYSIHYTKLYEISDLGVPLDYVEIRPGAPDDPISGALFAAGWQIGPRTFLIVNAGFCQGRPSYNFV